MAWDPLPTQAFSPAIERVRVLGTQLNVDLRDALVSASFDGSITETSQLTMKFVDPNFVALNTGLIVPGVRVDFEDYRLVVTNLDTGEVDGTEGFTVKARSVSVQEQKDLKGALVVTNMTPSEYVERSLATYGVRSVVQPSDRRGQIARDIPQPGESYSAEEAPSNWTTFQRLAEELGYVIFEVADVVYFGKPSWLINNVPDEIVCGYKIGDERYWVLGVPSCSKSLNSGVSSVEVELPTNYVSYAKPGKRLYLNGVPGFVGYYLTDSVELDLLNPSANVKVSASTPVDPVPRPPQEPAAAAAVGGGSSGGGSSGGSRLNSRSAEDFVYWAMRQIGDRYVYGSGPSYTIADPKQFDCSGLVRWALGRVGITDYPHQSEQQIAKAARGGGEISVSNGIRTRGALLWHQGHIAISLGNGKTVEAANSRVGVIQGNASGRFRRAAKIPGLRY